MSNNNIHMDRNTGSLYANHIRSDSYDIKKNPSYLTENYDDRCLFLNNNTSYNKVTQNNETNFKNPNNFGEFVFEDKYNYRPLIDNNIDENKRLEYIDERDIIIDTGDRNVSVYPNIFDFRLKLGSTETTVQPSVHRTINNVKYIKLQRAVFPDNYFISKSELNSSNTTHNTLETVITAFIAANFADMQNNTNILYDEQYINSNYKIYIIYHYHNLDTDILTIDYFLDSSYDGTTDTNNPNYNIVYSVEIDSASSGSSNLTHYFYSNYIDTKIEQGRYFQLHIDQLPKNNDLATNDSVTKSFCLLFPGKGDTRGFTYMDGFDTDKVFKYSNLGSFSTFSIKITDASGDVLKTNSDIWNMKLDNVSKKIKIENNNSSTNSYFKYSFRSANKYLRHPLAWRQQATFIFNIGEVNIELNKKPFN